MDTKWDVVVIGAGLGGLATAGLLAREGRRVLVLEQQAKPGGYAQGIRRNGFYFDISLRSMDGVAPGGWAHKPLKMMGVLDRVPFIRLDPYYVVRLAGEEITVPADPMQYEALLVRRFPGEIDGIRTLIDEMRIIYQETHRMRTDEVLDRQMAPEEMLQRYPHIIRASRESWSELMDRHISDPELKALFSVQWTSCGLPPSRLNAVALVQLWVSSHMYGGFYPRGGSDALNQAIEDVIRVAGGDVRCNQRVTEICVENGLARGVRTAQGLEVASTVIVSNANPAQTLSLIADGHLPSGYRKRVEVTADSLSSLNIYLGVKRSRLLASDFPHEMFVSESLNPEEEYAAIRAGKWDRVPFLLAHYTDIDPDGAPDGHVVISLMCLAPWDYENVWGTGGEIENYQENAAYQALKDAVADQLLARAERVLPGLQEAIVHREVATPLTNARYTLNRRGAIFGFEQSVEGMYQGRLNEETPLANLFYASAWTQPGGGQSAVLLSGYDGALHANKYLQRRATGEPPAPDPQPPQGEHGFLPVGQIAPTFELDAVGAGRRVGLPDASQRPMVLLFVTQNTTDAIGQMNEAIRSRFPLASQVTVASVVALGQVPSLFHRLINLALKRAYRQAAREVPADFDPADYVLILPDWEGALCRDFQIGDVDSAAAVVVDRAGIVRGTFQGENFITDTVNTLRWL